MAISTKSSSPPVAVVAKTRVVFCRLPINTYDRLTTLCEERSESLSDGLRAAVVEFLTPDKPALDDCIESLRRLLHQMLPELEQLSKMILTARSAPTENAGVTDLHGDQQQRYPE